MKVFTLRWRSQQSAWPAAQAGELLGDLLELRQVAVLPPGSIFSLKPMGANSFGPVLDDGDLRALPKSWKARHLPRSLGRKRVLHSQLTDAHCHLCSKSEDLPGSPLLTHISTVRHHAAPDISRNCEVPCSPNLGKDGRYGRLSEGFRHSTASIRA